MIFLTVGTQFPFDRLVKSVEQVIALNGFKEEIFAQIGDSSYQPHNFETVPFLEKHLFDKHVREATYIISHAGMGVITAALDNDKPLLVMPRRRRYGEVVNDHQLAIAKRFEQLGHILVAYEPKELPAKIEKLKSFVPQKRVTQVEAVVRRVSRFLTQINKGY